MILVDTSVWIDHLRGGIPMLTELLDQGKVLTHSAVIGELACGSMRQRDAVLTGIQDLLRAKAAEPEEILHLIETHRLWGRGIGWSDAQIVASAILSRCSLWTRDRSLLNVALELDVAIQF